METNRRAKRIPSGDMFSFPVINQDEFEFGSVASPASPNSPADRLFANGKLLPHAFPAQAGNAFSYSYSRSTSRASSKDYSSVMSSRSNSTNSRTSTSSSARTSTSEASERRPLRARDHHYYGGGGAVGRRERAVRSPVVMSCQYQYGASRRWQLIAAAPALKQRGSSSSSGPRRASDQSGAVADRKGAKKAKSNWFKRFVNACQECHAIKT
ncbi:uncharacterized protein LOC121775368 [Salvia splendens]|uniref:uncharacterized protein LOC121775368 n=1 Tax=Salvia splendens TaxID=180675 RepID=UPI001C254F9E|nr:uncharacterized protein LOC121775368 [Salvia splendens]